jgi:hypothetical protein
MAGLPLLRVRYRDVEPLFKRDTFLSNVIDVVLRYQNSLECPEYSKTYGEIARHDLPDIQRLRDRLARRHRIGCLHPTDGSEFVYQFNLGTSDYGSSETDEIHEGHMVLLRVAASVPAEEWPVAHRISKVLSLTTHYRTTEEPRPAWPKDGFDLASMQAYVKWLETDPWYFPDVPGVNWFYVAWNVPEALCVKQLLADADRGTFNCLLSRICG